MARRRHFLFPLLFVGACAHHGAADPGRDSATATSRSSPVLDVERVAPTGETAAAPVLVAMTEELARGMAALQTAADPPPYYMAYAVTELDQLQIVASDGALESADRDHERAGDVDIRVGSYAFDNNRIYRIGRLGASAGLHGRSLSGRAFPLEDDPAAIKAALWAMTQGTYRNAAQALAAAKARKDVQVEAEDDSDDFSREAPSRFLEAPVALTVDEAAWRDKVRAWSSRLSAGKDVLHSQVVLLAQAENRYLVTSEGSTVQLARPHARLIVTAATKAEDGMELQHGATIDVQSVAEFPDDAVVHALIDKVLAELAALRAAPVAVPYSGPAILEGRAAAVYFHEVFGHRVEGHRQKDESEGQTFAKKIGKRVMPEWIDVFDDPSIARLGGVDLNGHYFFDDEGVLGAKASLVEGGTLKGFLMSRSPTRGFEHSNGHGRRQSGMRVAARQANLVVAPDRGVDADTLKAKLIAEVEKQRKPFGLRFVEIAGGFTLTSRYNPQAFQVNPVLVYRVYPDGKEQLVRGAALEGTPLSSLQEIVAAGNEYEVFNGFCGAESGYVPVSAVSPSLLLDQIEVARTPKSQSKPPLLPAPEGPPKAAVSKTGGAK